jgi:FAD binding domain
MPTNELHRSTTIHPVPAVLSVLPPERSVGPCDPSYDDARHGWNRLSEQRPVAVVSPISVEEVRQVVVAARRDGLRIAVHSTGHNNGPLGPLDDAVLVRTDLMRDVVVDPVAQRVRAAAGARWGDVVDAVAPHALSVLQGSSPTVGVIGYTTGGGIGWYARSLGLAAHSLVSAEVVLPTGDVVRSSSTERPDLLWALRGGGASNFGVVTSVELVAYPFDTTYAGVLAWEESAVEPVLATWATWATDGPPEVTTSFRIVAFPDLPDVPAPFRGRRMVLIDGAVNADDRTAQRVLAPLRDLRPVVDSFARVPTATLTGLHMDPTEPPPMSMSTETALLDELPPAAVDAFLEVAGAGSDLFIAEIRQLGGALSTPRPDHAAISHLPGRFAVFGALPSPDEEQSTGRPTTPVRLVEAIRQWASTGVYLNFVERRHDVADGFETAAWDRLRRIRTAYDPSDTMRAVHPIPLLDRRV